MRLPTLLVVLVAVSGCAQVSVVEIANTSGITQQVAVFSGTDIYFADSVAAGQTKTWVVPDHARDRLVVLSVGVSRETEATAGWPTQLWADSVVLDRSRLIQIHTPAFVEATAAWTERSKRFGTVDRRDAVPPPADALAEIWDTRPANIRWPTAPHYVPKVSIGLKHAGSGGYFWLLGLSGLVIWMALFFGARWFLRRASRPRSTAVVLLVTASALGALTVRNPSAEQRTSYGVGLAAGSAATMLIPVLAAAAFELRRRRALWSESPGRDRIT